MRWLIIILLLTFSLGGFAQSKKKRKREEQAAPTSLDPAFTNNKNYGPKKSKAKKKGPTYESEQEYYDRMAKLTKTMRKNERLSEEPQYSDPTYFGHKRPPKRHKPGKMKLCKVCGIRH